MSEITKVTKQKFTNYVKSHYEEWCNKLFNDKEIEVVLNADLEMVKSVLHEKFDGMYKFKCEYVHSNGGIWLPIRATKFTIYPN